MRSEQASHLPKVFLVVFGLAIHASTFKTEVASTLDVPSPAAADERQRYSAHELISRALVQFDRATNFVASVDVRVIDRRSAESQASSAKESWKFSRNDGTNTFIRTRFTPVAGRELIESLTVAGGNIIANMTVELPPEISFPGFEIYNLLADMHNSATVVDHGPDGQVVLSASPQPGIVFRAYFQRAQALPFQMERLKGGTLTLVISRTDGSRAHSILPAFDAMHVYEAGQVTATVFRSYTKIKIEESEGTSSEDSNEQPVELTR